MKLMEVNCSRVCNEPNSDNVFSSANEQRTVYEKLNYFIYNLIGLSLFILISTIYHAILIQNILVRWLCWVVRIILEFNSQWNLCVDKCLFQFYNFRNIMQALEWHHSTKIKNQWFVCYMFNSITLLFMSYL